MGESRQKATAAANRPLSPHLQIYAPSISMVMSILHRLTGMALYAGTLLLAWWLVAAATSPEYYGYVSSWFSSLLGRAVLFGYTWALFHHMLGGIRHFLWDMIIGHDLKSVSILSWGTIALSLTLTFLVWVSVLSSGSPAPVMP